MGYVQSVNQSFVSDAYMNLTTELNASLRGPGSGMSITNTTHNGLQFFVLNISYPGGNGLNLTFAVGHKGNYLVFEAELGPVQMKSQLKNLMEQESNLI